MFEAQMFRLKTIPVIVGALLLPGAFAQYQIPNPTQKQLSVEPTQNIATFHVDVISRTMKAVNYHHRQGWTDIDFRGTALLPQGKGEARVDSRTGATKVDAHFDKLIPASTFGPEFVTYVLWAITPEGRTDNLGEVFTENGKSSIQASTDLQAFGLMVTAEPYFAVTQPSDAVVLENFIRPDTTGTIEEVDAKYELIKRGVYERTISGIVPQKPRFDKDVPLDLLEARNAVAIARNVGAEQYAADTLQKALTDLGNAEGYFASHRHDKEMQTVARRATQMASDARLIALTKMDDMARAEQARREQEATARAQEESRQRAVAEADKAAADRARADAEAASLKAQQDRAAAEAARESALQAKNEALAEQQRLAAEAARARGDAQQAELEKGKLREQLRQQLNMILETRDTARGLIVNMSDVLFDTAQYSLKPGAREKLAKVAGIVIAHPGLKLAVEGHTDIVGGDDYNQKLSENRANSVRDYLVSQGIKPENVTAQGFGKTRPVASNDTAAGRQQNRRVELVVTGDIIQGLPEDSQTTSQVR
jgi:outer membrane protein OmpA-like peptidoglycan-associated protein